MTNPLLINWETPFEAPPFNLIKAKHFREGVEEAIRIAEKEIVRITSLAEPPTFNNSIEALERSGIKLNMITSLLFNLNSAETNDELQEVAEELSPVLTKFSNDITLNKKLFERVNKIYENKDELKLGTEQLLLLEKTYRNFIQGGASLRDDQKQRFREISEKLGILSLMFDRNLLAETNSWELHITDRKDMDGLPENLIENAAKEAETRNKEGWIFTLHAPSYVPFMQYSTRRDLREKMLRANTSRAFRGNENDNRTLVIEIANLRLELALILGYANYAEMVLSERMADTTDKVNGLLDKLYEASKPAALRDFENVRKSALKNGHLAPLEKWDWYFYSEILKKELYEFDDELLKPYFSLESTEKAVFDLATKLYGITFIHNSSVPVYHPEVKTYEVYDGDGKFLAILYTDYHPRTGKNGGAWMTSYRDQRVVNGNDIRPLISIVTNFTRATNSKPSLLSFNEVRTFLHEFGHALHGMLSQCTYESLSGTNVARDFVELPSQFMENFAFEKEWLDTWAIHYMTGKPIPEHLIRKIREASLFNEGYSCYRQLGFGFLDMDWHSVTSPVKTDVSHFETPAVKKTELFPEVSGSNVSCSFSHIFAGGYAAGYYGYKWAEVLDADAYGYFTEKGIFNPDIATSFRKNILEKGGSERPMELYKKFRGKKPSIEPLLKRSGLL